MKSEINQEATKNCQRCN